MPGDHNANIKLLYASEPGVYFTAETVTRGEPFDVIASVEIGRGLMADAAKEELYVTVINVSRSVTMAQQMLVNQLVPRTEPDPHREELRIRFDAGWKATEGDVLEAVATYKVTAGDRADYSWARTGPIIVSA